MTHPQSPKTEFYTIIQFTPEGRKPVYIVDGPDICPHCLALRVPGVAAQGSAATQSTPSAIMIDTPAALETRFADDWLQIAEGLSERAAIMKQLAADEMIRDFLTIRPESLN